MGDLPLSGPDELEQKEYYHGLASKPQLIARTSTHRWPPPRPATEAHGAHHDAATSWTQGSLTKRLCPIRSDSDGRWGIEEGKTEEQHPILAAWSPALRGALVSALAQSPLQHIWSAFFPIRVTAQWPRTAPGHSSTTSVVLMLCVAPGSDATWSMGLSAAGSCRSILQMHGVFGMEVEVCKAAVSPLVDENPDAVTTQTQASTMATASLSLDRFENFSYASMLLPSTAINYLSPFCHRPGQLLERMKVGPGGSLISAGTGSLGFYLSLSGQAEQEPQKAPIFAITSRHVAVGRLLPHNATHAQETQPIHVRWGTQESLARAANKISQVGRAVRFAAHDAIKRFENDEAKQSEAIRGLEFADKYVPEVVGAMHDAAAADNTRRCIGDVAYAAPHRRTEQGAWSDWALIQLNEPTASTIRRRPDRNGVFVPDVDCSQFITTAIRHGLACDGVPFPRDTNGVLSFHHLSHNAAAARWPRWVMKRGAKTGVTIGVTSEIEAVFRVPLDDGHFRVAFALIVLDFAGDLEKEHTLGHFSAKGDSGSAVFDVQGRLVGLIDAGVGANEPPLRRHFQKPGEGVELPQSLAAQDAAAAAAAATTDLPQGFSPHSTAAILGGARLSDQRVDVTLVTPIDWLLEDIEAVTGKVPTVL